MGGLWLRRAIRPSLLDSLGPAAAVFRTSRYGRTPGWMVFHPAWVRPLGTNNCILAQLKPTGCPKGCLRWGAGASLPLISPRTGTWGQTLSGLAVTPRPPDPEDLDLTSRSQVKTVETGRYSARIVSPGVQPPASAGRQLSPGAGQQQSSASRPVGQAGQLHPYQQSQFVWGVLENRCG